MFLKSLINFVYNNNFKTPNKINYACSGINFSKCFLAAAMFNCVREVGMRLPVPVVIIIIYVLPVNMSIYAVKCELRTSIAWNCDCDFEQLILNCLIIFDMRSNR